MHRPGEPAEAFAERVGSEARPALGRCEAITPAVITQSDWSRKQSSAETALPNTRGRILRPQHSRPRAEGSGSVGMIAARAILSVARAIMMRHNSYSVRGIRIWRRPNTHLHDLAADKGGRMRAPSQERPGFSGPGGPDVVEVLPGGVTRLAG